jgi:hypothetical protein
VTPTTWRDLVGPAALALAVGFVVVRLIGAITGSVPAVPSAAVVSVLVLALGVVVTTVVLRPRLLRRAGRAPVPPLTAARVVALAFAASRTGAVIAGFCLGWLLTGLIDDGIDTPFGRTRAIGAGAAAIGGAVLLGAGVVLERACRVRPSDDDEKGRSAAEGDDGADDGGHVLGRR